MIANIGDHTSARSYAVHLGFAPTGVVCDLKQWPNTC